MDPYLDNFRFTPRIGRSLRVIVVGAGIGGLTAGVGEVHHIYHMEDCLILASPPKTGP